MTETRTALIALDGRHVWLGRYSVPTQEEYAQLHQTLLARNLSADAYTVTGDYWSENEQLHFEHILSLGVPHSENGIAAFLEARHARFSSV